mmetsp:Transcript_30933/g.77226  ORF Transcript_30933/g.77226 Transcript_30933/m.77226 type:complete len:230 (-) Transcript_30933:5-694(-)
MLPDSSIRGNAVTSWWHDHLYTSPPMSTGAGLSAAMAGSELIETCGMSGASAAERCTSCASSSISAPLRLSSTPGPGLRVAEAPTPPIDRSDGVFARGSAIGEPLRCACSAASSALLLWASVACEAAAGRLDDASAGGTSEWSACCAVLATAGKASRLRTISPAHSLMHAVSSASGLGSSSTLHLLIDAATAAAAVCASASISPSRAASSDSSAALKRLASSDAACFAT